MQLENLSLMDSKLNRLDMGGVNAVIKEVNFIRTPIEKIDIGAGRIDKMMLKEIPLPYDWNIEEKAHIDSLFLKQPLLPLSFHYRGKRIPTYQIQMGSESKTYTNVPGERLVEVLKKQIALGGGEKGHSNPLLTTCER